MCYVSSSDDFIMQYENSSNMYIIVGTGTPAGDPVETNTLGRFFYQARTTAFSKTDKLLIGSVKTNIGHTESAAGVAGLIKVLLMMRNGKIVPSLHIKKDKSNLNPAIRLNEYNLDIPVEVEDWKADDNGDKIACISSYGFGGSNGHAILIQKESFNVDQISTIVVSSKATSFVAISSASLEGLKQTLDNFTKQITQNPDLALDSISYTSTCHRDHFPNRACFAVQSLEDLAKQASAKVKVEKHQQLPLNLVFVYCGVGTTWTGMCSQLIKLDKAFKAGVIEVDKYLTPLSGISMEDLFVNPSTDYSDPFVNHVAIFTAQVALTFMWRNLGVQPNAIIGQSVGEVAAAYASESIDLKTAVDVIYHRSKVLADHPGGSMMVVKNVPLDEVERLCDHYKGRVSVAVYSSPIACTLSGEINEMKKVRADIQEYCEKQNIDVFIKELDVSCAYHSHMVDKCMPELKQNLKPGVKLKRKIPVISTVTGRQAVADELQSVEYWAQNIRKPVLMNKAILISMKEKQNNVILEIGPKPVIRAHIHDIVKTGPVECLSSMTYSKEISTRSATIGKLFENGVDIEWNNEVKVSQLCSVPTYAFDRRKLLFIPEEERRKYQGIKATPVVDHMFLRSSLTQGKEFHLAIGEDTTPYVFEHFMGGTLLVPGSTYVDATFAIAVRKLHLALVDISVYVELEHMHTPSADRNDQIECIVDVDNEELTITYSKGNRIFSVGRAKKGDDLISKTVPVSNLIESYDKVLTKSDIYTALEDLGFKYGPSLRLIERVWYSNTDCIAEIHVPANVLDEFNTTHVHPSVVDSVFQIFGVFAKGTGSNDDVIVPKGLKAMRMHGYPQKRMFCYTAKSRTTGKHSYFNATLLDEAGGIICEIVDFYTQKISSKTDEDISHIYSLQWHEVNPITKTKENDPPSSLDVLMFGTEETICFAENMFENTHLEILKLNSNQPSSQIEDIKVFELLNKKRYHAMIYAHCSVNPLSETQSGVTYIKSKWNVVCLKDLLCILSRSSIKVPFFVMTNNTQTRTERSGTSLNVCGAELWGMVRCAQHESIYHDIRLLDIDINNCDPQALLTVINDNFPSEKELKLEGKSIWKSRLVQETFPDAIKKQKVLSFEEGTIATLKSCHPNEIKAPFYELVEHSFKDVHLSPDFVRIRLRQSCVHDVGVFPVTSCSFSQKYLLWPSLSDEGFTSYAIEGEGLLVKEHNAKSTGTIGERMYFCYPVDIATYVDIPNQCVFTTSDIPFYTPGLLTLSVVLYCSVSHVQRGTSLAVLCDDSVECCQVFVERFLEACGNKIVRCLYKESLRDGLLQEEREALKSVNGVIVLSKLNSEIIEKLLESMPSLQYIITLAVFLPMRVRHMVAMVQQEITVIEHLGEKVFKNKNLVNIMPSIRTVLRKIHGKESIKDDLMYKDRIHCKNPLTLPRETISLSDNDSELNLYASSRHMFRKHSCYIVVGGLTGLGWILARFIAENGGGYLASLSRRKPSIQQQNDMETLMHNTGCKIKAYQCDITDMRDLGNTIECIQKDLDGMHIKGIFNGAGVLDDGLLVNMTEEQVEKVLKPKVLGSMNLHFASKHLALDFFVMQSSIVSINGNIGQSNYGAANSFIDALVHHRRSQNLNSQTINWGPLDVGMAQQNPEIKQRLQQIGMSFLTAQDICYLFQETLAADKCQTVLGSFNWSVVGKHLVSTKLGDLVSLELNTQEKEDEHDQLFDVSSFEILTDDRKEGVLFDHIVQVLLSVLPVTDSVSLGRDLQIGELGVDSVAAMSFVNKLHDLTGCRVPIQMILSDTATLHDIMVFLKGNINVGHDGHSSSDQFLETDTKLSFIEKEVLLDYASSSCKENFAMIVDFVVQTNKWDLEMWTKLLRHVVFMNPLLCRRFVVTSDGITIHEVSGEDVEVKIEPVPVDDMTNSDPRDRFCFELENELPVRFQIAFDRDCTYIRVVVHAVVLDLRTQTLINRDIKDVANSVLRGHEMPRKKEAPNIPQLLHTQINKRYHNLKSFWSQQMRNVTQNASLNESVDIEALDSPSFRALELEFQDDTTDRIMSFIRKHKLTLFHFFLTAFQLLLHGETYNSTVAVLSEVNMRIHHEQLKDAHGRCINSVPFVANIREDATVLDFFFSNSKIAISATEHSLYPAYMIVEEIPDQKLRKYFPRHALYMDDMTEIEQLKQKSDERVDIKKVWHNTNGDYETILRVLLDTQSKKISCSFEYNQHVCSNARGEKMRANFLMLVEHCISNQHKTISTVMKDTGIRNVTDNKRLERLEEFQHDSQGSISDKITSSSDINVHVPLAMTPSNVSPGSRFSDVEIPNATNSNSTILKSGTVLYLFLLLQHCKYFTVC